MINIWFKLPVNRKIQFYYLIFAALKWISYIFPHISIAAINCSHGANMQSCLTHGCIIQCMTPNIDYNHKFNAWFAISRFHSMRTQFNNIRGAGIYRHRNIFSYMCVYTHKYNI